MWQSTGGISWRAPLYGNLKACSLRDALIVSNRRVAKYLSMSPSILRGIRKLFRARVGMEAGRLLVRDTRRPPRTVSLNRVFDASLVPETCLEFPVLQG